MKQTYITKSGKLTTSKPRTKKPKKPVRSDVIPETLGAYKLHEEFFDLKDGLSAMSLDINQDATMTERKPTHTANGKKIVGWCDGKPATSLKQLRWLWNKKGFWYDEETGDIVEM